MPQAKGMSRIMPTRNFGSKRSNTVSGKFMPCQQEDRFLQEINGVPGFAAPEQEERREHHAEAVERDHRQQKDEDEEPPA